MGELSVGESDALARSLMGEGAPAAQAHIVARESGGSPFFITELARYFTGVADSDIQATPRSATLGELIRSRVARLPARERHLLEVAAVAGEPVERRILARAAGITEDEPAVLARLRTAHLIRDSGTSGREGIETYHDRIRETLVENLAPETVREHHRQLAVAMEASAAPDPERMSIHFWAAGDGDRAARYTLDAAGRAAEALAFDRAARLYRLALEHPAPKEMPTPVLRVKLAEALSGAGRSREAAVAYLAAAGEVGRTEAIELRRCAAEQLLRGGYMAEGMSVIAAVLEAMGMKLPSTRRRALLGLLLRRARVRLRGLRFRPRVGEIPREERTRIDACWSVALGLAFVDPVVAGSLQAQQLLWSLRSGDTYRVVRAIAAESGYSSLRGGRNSRRTARLVETAGRLADEIGNPHAQGLAVAVAGIAGCFEGRWKTSHALLVEAERQLRERCTGLYYELANAVYWRLYARFHCGHVREVRDSIPDLLKDAHERGDLYLGTNLRLRLSYLVELCADDPPRASRELDRGISAWSFIGFSNQNWWELLGRIQIHLYRRDGATAWDALQAAWPALQRSMILRIQLMRLLAADLKGRAAVAAAASGGSSPPELLRTARKCADVIEGEKMTWAVPSAELVRAGIASCEERRAEAIAHLRAAAEGYSAADMILHAVVSRRRLGGMLGGADGAALVAEADAWMAGQQIANPVRMAAMLAPGRWE